MKQLLAGMAGIVLLAGCASNLPTKDHVSAGFVKVQPVETPEAALPTTSVHLDGDVMKISGIIKRKPGYNGPLDGHVRIEFASPTGEVLNEFPLDWDPQDVPITGERQAQYAIDYGWVPPQGTTMRVTIEEDAEFVGVGNGTGGGDSSGPRTAGGPQKAPSGIRTPRPTGQAKSGHAGGTPGTPRQRTSTPSTPGASRGGRGHR
jgi:hypothetical protein